MNKKGIKRSLGLFLSLVLLSTLLLCCIPANADTVLRASVGETVKTNVNVREKNTTDSRTLTTLSKSGTQLTVLGEADGWYKVQVAGVTGYIRQDLMKVTKEGVIVKDALKKGDKSEAVKIMQERLIALNYLKDSADGVFGENTRQAVIAFQKDQGLTADGEAGDKTLQALLKAEESKQPDVVPSSGQTLRYGMRNEEVKELQTNLKTLGYFSDHTATGYFGKATKESVIAFQQDHDLKADGIVGVLTMTAIQTALKGGTDQPVPQNPETTNPSIPSAEATPDVQPTPTPTAEPVAEKTPEGTPALSVGSKGDSVKKAQNILIQYGYLKDKADGVFGAKTEKAVRAFQKAMDIEANGIIGPVTWAALEDLTTVTKLQSGDSGEEVTRLQNRLIVLGYLSGTAGGQYDADTEEAVKAFQEANGLAVDGIAGSQTLEKLYSTKAVSKKDADLTPDSSVTLKKGMENDDVKAMQLRLIELKYLSADATGFFGTATASAVRSFQASNGLTVDGVAGPKTLSKLYSDEAKAYDPSKSGAILEDWNTGFINSAWARGTKAKITDVVTGTSYWVQRKGGTKHVDAEPLTANDTKIMDEVFGHKSTWTNIRAIVVWIDGKPYAAAQNFMPHGEASISDNNFDGHFCIHFLHSRTHGGDAENPNMQEKVKYAYENYK